MRLHYLVAAVALCLGALNCSNPGKRSASTGEQGRRILYYHDPMHPSYRSDRPGIAPDCNMQLTPVFAESPAARKADSQSVRVSGEQAAIIGLQTEVAREELATGEVRTIGRVEAQESRRFLVTAGADGWIRHVFGGETGSKVIKGQALAAYYSRDLTPPQQAYLYALEAESRLAGTGTGEQKDLARRQVVQARDYLESLGLTAVQIERLAKSQKEDREVTIGAPASGIVLERKISEGARVNHGDVLWAIGDIDAVWITADLFPEDWRSVSAQRNVTLGLPGGIEMPAIVDVSLPAFENADRVAKVRLTANNREHRLLPGMTVTVIFHRASMNGLTVPVDAVLEGGIKPRVVVRQSDGTFQPRLVSTGWRSGGRQQILSGLKAGDEVVTSGAFLIDSESRWR